jgi:hypothetical protein
MWLTVEMNGIIQLIGDNHIVNVRGLVNLVVSKATFQHFKRTIINLNIMESEQ